MSQCVEGIWIVAEIGNVEDGFCVGKIELCEVGVEAGFWGAEVGDAGGGGDTGAGEDDYSCGFAIFDVLGY